MRNAENSGRLRCKNFHNFRIREKDGSSCFFRCSCLERRQKSLAFELLFISWSLFMMAETDFVWNNKRKKNCRNPTSPCSECSQWNSNSSFNLETKQKSPKKKSNTGTAMQSLLEVFFSVVTHLNFFEKVCAFLMISCHLVLNKFKLGELLSEWAWLRCLKYTVQALALVSQETTFESMTLWTSKQIPLKSDTWACLQLKKQQPLFSGRWWLKNTLACQWSLGY